MTNDELWDMFTSRLKKGTIIYHWSAYSQYQLDGRFAVSKLDPLGVWIDIAVPELPSGASPTRTRQRVNLVTRVPVGKPYEVPIDRKRYLKREQFFEAWSIWNDYCSQTISRTAFDRRVLDSTYIISIIHWVIEKERTELEGKYHDQQEM